MEHALRNGLKRAHQRPQGWELARVGLAVIAGLGLLSLLYLSQASLVATQGYDIQSLESMRARWEAKNQQLRYGSAELRSVARIEKEARERLKMGPPSKVAFLRVTAPPAQPLAGRAASKETATGAQRQPSLWARWLAWLSRGVGGMP